MKNQKKTGGCGTFILAWAIVAVLLGIVFNTINKTGQSAESIVLASIVLGFFFAFFIWIFRGVTRAKKDMRNRNQINPASGNGTFVPKPPIVPSAKIVNQEVPQETLYDDMRMAYAVNEMRIIDESLRIMETTSDIETFLSRYETAMKCVLTLEQAKKAGQQIALPDGYSQSLVSAKNKALTGVVYRSFKKELDEINKLKTESGKLDRIKRYQEKIKNIYEAESEFFADVVYNDIMQKLELLKKGMGYRQDENTTMDSAAEIEDVRKKHIDSKQPKCNCDGCPKQDACEYGHVVCDDITKKRMSLFDKFMRLHAYDSFKPANNSCIATVEELHNKKLLLKLDLSTLNDTLTYLLEQKEKYLAVGKCGRAYFNFMKMGDEISLVKETIREYDEYQVMLMQKNLVKSYVLDKVSKEGEFRQEEAYRNFPDIDRKNVTSAIRELEKLEYIIREKSGKTYIIRKNNA